ncbi:uncharacterized protein LOC131639037 [Vicia villosa]|uniref:uncharacterized protein LOC131639037 n=1 Tax=Vicia villosa TaxID=3911 RepID=UPI00273BC7F6|nr:uncharacterized protein LOC131639037 [Vicia villosa]
MAENLWVQWMHSYYFAKTGVMTYDIKASNSWIAKRILSQRGIIPEVQHEWEASFQRQKFKVSTFYNCLIDNGNRVIWRNILRNNKARPRATFCLWVSCHNRLATKVRMARLGFLPGEVTTCSLCKLEEEDMEHLFFECPITGGVWASILDWIDVKHQHQNWNAELCWISNIANRKGWKMELLKVALAETVYGIWTMRNKICFDGIGNSLCIENSIKDTILYRVWQYRKLRIHIANLML